MWDQSHIISKMWVRSSQMLYLLSFPTVYTKVLSSGLCEAEAHGIKETVQTHKKVSSLIDLAIFTFTVKCSNFHVFPVSPNSSCEVAGAVAHNASNSSPTTSNTQINGSPSSAVQYANTISAKLWTFKEQRWTCNATRTCRQCSGSRWHDRQRSRSCLLPALHQLYE